MRALFLVLMALSLISINVNRLRDGNKRTGLLQYLRCLPNPPPPPDVVCLQELHYVSEAEVRDWFRSLGFSVLASPGSSRSCGCAIFYKSKLTLVASFCDASGRFLHCSFSFADVTFNVPCLLSLPPELSKGPVPCLGCRELWGTLSRSWIVVWIGLGLIWTTRRVKVPRL